MLHYYYTLTITMRTITGLSGLHLKLPVKWCLATAQGWGPTRVQVLQALLLKSVIVSTNLHTWKVNSPCTVYSLCVLHPHQSALGRAVLYPLFTIKEQHIQKKWNQFGTFWDGSQSGLIAVLFGYGLGVTSVAPSLVILSVNICWISTIIST